MLQNKKALIITTCANQLLDCRENKPLKERIKSILEFCKFEVKIIQLENECCGLMYSSQGQPKIADQKRESINKILNQFSEYNIMLDNSSCAQEILIHNHNIKVHDATIFIAMLLEEYEFKKTKNKIMLHINCSVTKLKQNHIIEKIANKCAQEVIIPPDIMCCGFAGNRGFMNPELNRNALRDLKLYIPKDCTEGYTCLQTCSVGFSNLSGIPYFHLLQLIEESL